MLLRILDIIYQPLVFPLFFFALCVVVGYITYKVYDYIHMDEYEYDQEEEEEEEEEELSTWELIKLLFK